MAWKYSLPALPRSRVEQFGQWMALEQKYSVPSRAISNMVAKAAEARQTARPAFEGRQSFGEHRIKQSRLCWVQHVANVIVAGDLGDPKQALAIRAPVPMLQPPLMRQERRALHKEHREGCHPDIAHSIARIHPATLVRKPVQASAQRGKKRRKQLHPARESDSRCRANPLMLA